MKDETPCDRPKRVHLYGIDPGSGKAWAVYRACFDLESCVLVEQPTYDTWELTSLDECIRELLNKTSEPSTATMLAIDVPVVTPHEFIPDYIGVKSSQYPFNVYPFTMRPCECALRSLPGVVDRSLAFPVLTSLIGKLCKWGKPFRSSSNVPFQKLDACEGVSVMIFSEAPHQPVMQVFRKALADRAGKVTISTIPATANALKSSHLYFLESHPAVSMGFWAIDGRLHSVSKVPRYKGTLRGEMGSNDKKETIPVNLVSLATAIAAFTTSIHGLSSLEPIINDDRLDAFVGLVNLLDLVTGKGDWFGTAASGYFLIPQLRLLNGSLFSDAWELAEASVRQANYMLRADRSPLTPKHDGDPICLTECDHNIQEK